MSTSTLAAGQPGWAIHPGPLQPLVQSYIDHLVACRYRAATIHSRCSRRLRDPHNNAKNEPLVFGINHRVVPPTPPAAGMGAAKKTNRGFSAVPGRQAYENKDRSER
jgi:hypothetical protein